VITIDIFLLPFDGFSAGEQRQGPPPKLACARRGLRTVRVLPFS
jgi:hypothetical protein